MAATCLLAACGGGGGSSDNGIDARVPSGSGQRIIQMVGTWEIRQAVVIETNDPNAAPPLNGTPVVIGIDGALSIGGLSVARADLELLLGFPLELYVNRQDGRTLLYGIVADGRAVGGVRQQVGLAGGSVDDNTIAVEQYSSTQTTVQANETYVRSRYVLARIGAAVQTPASAKLDGEPHGDLTRALAPLFGR